MATNYPGGLDSFNNPSANTPENATGYEHDLQHANVNDAVEAIEAELGTNPSGTYSTVASRISDITSITERTAHVPNAIYTPRSTPFYEADLSSISGWTYVYPAGKQNVTWTTDGYGGVNASHMTGIGDGGGGYMQCLLIPVGTSFSPGDAIETAYTYQGGLGDYSMIGIGFTNGTTHGTSNIVQAQNYFNSFRINTNPGMTGDGAQGATLTPIHWVPFHMRIVMTAANTWRSDASSDGIHWWNGGGTVSYTLDPTHMGFIVSNWNTGKKFNVTYHYFRRYSGVS